MSASVKALRAYAELSRLSNLPTCISNVLVGGAIGMASGSAAGAGSSTPTLRLELAGRLGGCAVAVCLLYVAGMALNDLVDRRVDAIERPGRPIPSGRVSVAGAQRFVWVCMTLGVGILAILGVASFVLAMALGLSIITYDLVHKKAAAAVVLMGACRGLVYLATAAAVAPGSAWWPPGLDWTVASWLAGAITVYIVLLTVVARSEAHDTPPPARHLSLLLPLVVLAPGLVVRPESRHWIVMTGVLVTGWLLWSARHVLRRPPATRRAILGWLAAICLVDAHFLVLLDRPYLAAGAVACFALTFWGHRRITGT